MRGDTKYPSRSGTSATCIYPHIFRALYQRKCNNS